MRRLRQRRDPEHTLAPTSRWYLAASAGQGPAVAAMPKSGLKSPHRGGFPVRVGARTRGCAPFFCASTSLHAQAHRHLNVLIIGAGPIVIGQACEFDYSGTQACKALREEGYRVVLVNSNPATIMTDPEFADRTYIEPITPEIVEKIIEKEHYASRRLRAVADPGRADRAEHRDGAAPDRRAGQIRRGNDRRQRRRHRQGRRPRAVQGPDDRDRPRRSRIGAATTLDEARDSVGQYRPSRSSSGRRSRSAAPAAASPTTARNSRRSPNAASMLSPVSEILIEESLLGWKEYEMEVDARQDRQLRHHLLDRKLRSDGRAHRRLHHRRADPDADGQGIPDHARRLVRGHSRGRASRPAARTSSSPSIPTTAAWSSSK